MIAKAPSAPLDGPKSKVGEAWRCEMVRDDVACVVDPQQKTDPAIPTWAESSLGYKRTKYKLVVLPGLCIFVSGLLAAVASRPPF